MNTRRTLKYPLIIGQDTKLINAYIEQKKVKKTVLEKCYLLFFKKKEFESVYLSFSASRKVYFTLPEIIDLVQMYDRAEMRFAENIEDKTQQREFFAFFENFVEKFERNVDLAFNNLLSHTDIYQVRYYAGNYIGEEIRKCVGVIMDSKTKAGNYFVFQLLEKLAEKRIKIAFKGYEKMGKLLLKDAHVDPELFRRYTLSYSKIHEKLKRNYRGKIMKLFGSQVHKLIGDMQNVRTFEGLCQF